MASLAVYFDACADHTAIPFLEARGITAPQEPTRPDRFSIRYAMLVAWVTATESPANRLFRWADLQRLITDGALADSFTDEEIALALGRR